MRNLVFITLWIIVLMMGCDQTSKQQTMPTNGNTDTVAATREKNLDVIKRFFDLLHQKNAAAWGDLWDENGFIYIPYPVANFPDTIKTRKTILEGFEHLLAGFKSFDYHIKEIYPSVDPDVIVVEYTVAAVLVKTNATYNGINLAIFKFRNGKIVAYHDYFNPEKFKMVAEALF
jgi:ketosteroid isomerase-like protein